MNTSRRDFLTNLGARVSGAAAAVATPTVTYAASFSEEIKRLSGDFQQKLTESTSLLGKRIDQVNNRMDSAAVTLAYQQAQLHLIFLLLLISFIIDGGMSLSWLLTP